MGWTHEQSASDPDASVAFGSNVKAGSLLIACFNSGQAPFGRMPSDTRGNSWTRVGHLRDVNDQDVALWFAVSKDAGALTVNFISGAFDFIVLSEWSLDVGVPTWDGLAVAPFIQLTAVAPGTDVLVSRTVVASQDSSLALGLYGNSFTDLDEDKVAGTGWTMRAQAAATGARTALESKTTDKGPVTATFSSPAGTETGAIGVAVFNDGRGRLLPPSRRSYPRQPLAVTTDP